MTDSDGMAELAADLCRVALGGNGSYPAPAAQVDDADRDAENVGWNKT